MIVDDESCLSSEGTLNITFKPTIFSSISKLKTIVVPQIAQLIRDLNIHSSKIHCIGHSLGSHLCGFLGKKLKANGWGHMNRISGSLSLYTK